MVTHLWHLSTGRLSVLIQTTVACKFHTTRFTLVTLFAIQFLLELRHVVNSVVVLQLRFEHKFLGTKCTRNCGLTGVGQKVLIQQHGVDLIVTKFTGRSLVLVCCHHMLLQLVVAGESNVTDHASVVLLKLVLFHVNI